MEYVKGIFTFILGYTGSSLLCSGFLSLQRVGTSHCGGFSCGARALGTWALSTCYSQALSARGLNSCGAWA